MQSEHARRLAICESCEHLQRPKYRCGLCGCLMKVKVLLPKQKCPDNRWDQLNKPNPA